MGRYNLLNLIFIFVIDNNKSMVQKKLKAQSSLKGKKTIKKDITYVKKTNTFQVFSKLKVDRFLGK